MNTYPEHIGNELGKLTDKDLHRVLLQYVEKILILCRIC